MDNNKNPIPFVNIGIVDGNYGTISKLNGKFKLDLREMNPDDTLRFSSLGYISKDLLVKEINYADLNVFLDDRFIPIEEVQIRPGLKKSILFGKRKIHQEGGFGFGGLDGNFEGCEVGMLFSNSEMIYLKEFQFHLRYSNYDSIKFRLNIYSFQDSVPSMTINRSPIYITTNLNKGWVKKDLLEYDIVLEDNFVITLEPVQVWDSGVNFSNKGNQIILSGKFNNNGLQFSRICSLGKWRKSQGSMDYYLIGN
jgi:hypothetical protein